MSVQTGTVHDARLRMMAARIIAQKRWPYVTSLLFNLRLIETPHEQLQTMAVDDGWRLYYSPVFVLKQTPEALATVLLHECLHCMHKHCDRWRELARPVAEHPAWNLAGDAVINEVLAEEEMPWPTTPPVRYADLIEYGVESGATTEQAFFTMVPRVEEFWSHSWTRVDCGSVVGGHARTYELPPLDEDSPSINTSHQDLIRDLVAHGVIHHAKASGSVPGALLRWAESLTSPKIGWREALASRVRRELSSVAGRRDYVYTRPSRRQEAMRVAGSDLILPAMRQPAPPRVACVVDTSGSISRQELRDFVSEVVGITRASGIASGVTVIACDAEARPPQRVRSRADADGIRLQGGGGTDMGAGITAATDLRPRPHIIVVFTDGYTPWPDQPPKRIDSVIVVLSSESQRAKVPGWAQVIMLDS